MPKGKFGSKKKKKIRGLTNNFYFWFLFHKTPSDPNNLFKIKFICVTLVNDVI